MAASGFFNITVMGQMKYKADQDMVVRVLQENVKLLDTGSRFDSTLFGGTMLIMNFSGTLTGIGSFSYWLTRFRSKLKQYFTVADFKFNMQFGE
jgi:hypothetical protein